MRVAGAGQDGCQAAAPENPSPPNRFAVQCWCSLTRPCSYSAPWKAAAARLLLRTSLWHQATPEMSCWKK